MGGVNTRQAGYYEFSHCSLIACRNRISKKASKVPKPPINMYLLGQLTDRVGLIRSNGKGKTVNILTPQPAGI